MTPPAARVRPADSGWPWIVLGFGLLALMVIFGGASAAVRRARARSVARSVPPFEEDAETELQEIIAQERTVKMLDDPGDRNREFTVTH